MNFYHILTLVVYRRLCQFLQWNDLLRMRKVCTKTKQLTDAYLMVNSHRAPEIEINEDEKSFEAFWNMGIRTTKLFINNTSVQFYEKHNEEIVRFFSQDYSHLIKNLRINQMSLYIFGKERDFMESLVNLKSLDVEYFGFGQDPKKELMMSWKKVVKLAKISAAVSRHKDPRYIVKSIPASFMSLETIKIRKGANLFFDPCINLSVEPRGAILGRSCVIDLFFYSCKELQYHAVPPMCLLMSNLPTTPICDHVASLVASLHVVATIFSHPDITIWSSLKVIDFLYYDYDLHITENLSIMESAAREEASRRMVHLHNLCFKHHVKLLNVGSSWFHQRLFLPVENDDRERLDSPDLNMVVSVVNISSDVLLLNMANLEFIDIRQTSQSYVTSNWRSVRREWPALKRLNINVDSMDIWIDCDNEEARMASHLSPINGIFYNIFFRNVVRPTLSELTIKFDSRSWGVLLPNTKDIVASCPNLKKLSICNWPGTNKALIKLWKGLSGLEEISLEDCEKLEDNAFVGEDVRVQKNPVFLKLKKLKKLTLKGLDKMPKITDTLFSLVLARLKLTHLILTSQEPIKQITMNGIKFLLDGEFADTIEKFPFREWSLADATDEEFEKLEKEFRSYDML